ncbi:N-acetylmuramic acid 6-phosphate etherase, partial [Escherichia coli]|nr:N-acetylmuramic acid 6-phosphate etherase [Escherichia coli]
MEAGKRDFLAHHPAPEDVVIALAASGTTPYPQGVLLAAREVGALRIGIANNPHTPVLQLSEVPIALETG